jgi:hypothetical protein
VYAGCEAESDQYSQQHVVYLAKHSSSGLFSFMTEACECQTSVSETKAVLCISAIWPTNDTIQGIKVPIVMSIQMHCDGVWGAENAASQSLFHNSSFLRRSQAVLRSRLLVRLTAHKVCIAALHLAVRTRLCKHSDGVALS